MTEFSGANQLLYGKSVTYDETSGLYTLNDTIKASHIVSLDDTEYSDIYNNYKYTCFPQQILVQVLNILLILILMLWSM